LSRMDVENPDVVMRSAAAFRAVATCAPGDTGGPSRARSLELYMASDNRPTDDQLWSLVLVGAQLTADEIKEAGGKFPESVSAAIDAPSPVDPRAGAFAAVLAELDHDGPAAALALSPVRDVHGTDGLVIAVGYLCRLFQDTRRSRRTGGQARRGRDETRTPGGEPT
jgi:hypothetical protein